MSNIRPPQFGVKKDELTLTSQDPAAVLYGVTSDNKWIPIKITDDGSLVIGSTVTLEMSDIEIGAVELKNYNTDDRIYVSPAHEALTQARLYDAAGLGLTSSTLGLKQALDINVVGGTTISASEAEDDSIPAGMNLAAVITLGYGYDGIDWQRLHSASNRLLVDGSQVTQPISAVSLPLPTGASTEATLLAVKTQTDKLTFAATRLLVDGSGVTQPISAVALPLPTGAATEATLATRATEATLSGFRTDFNAVNFSTETTLLAVKTDLDKFTFLGGSVNSNITNATLAVTQSGVWSTGRTWTLASGTDSVSAVQSGTWNINNISGTISLPTGAATEATLSAINTKLVTGTVIGDVNAAQKGTWNLNNISGTISLPTGAATEATLLAAKVDLDKFTFASTRLLVDGSGVIQPVSQSGNWSVRLQDGSGNAITSTGNALDVNLKSPIQVSVDTSQTDDSILVYGNDGVTNRAIKTDTSGDVLVDPIDKTTRELGRVLASDSVIISETYSTSSNVYSNARPVNGDMSVRHYKTKKIYVKNTSAFNGRMEIFGSVDDGANFDVTIVPDQALNAGVTSITDLTDAVTHLQIQVRSQNNGQTTTFVSKAYALGV